MHGSFNTNTDKAKYPVRSMKAPGVSQGHQFSLSNTFGLLNSVLILYKEIVEGFAKLANRRIVLI